MHQKFSILIAWCGILIIGFTLRLNNLETRPMHADEATGARILSIRLEGQGYVFNPKHFHGPLLSWATVPLARLQDQSNWTELRKVTLRLSTLLAGTLLILTPLLWLRALGHAGTLLGASFIATSPLLVYYSQMYIHESWLVLFAMLTFGAIFRWSQAPSLFIASLAGILTGLMYATKETFIVSIFSWLVALAVCSVIQKKRYTVRDTLGAIILLPLSAMLTASYFYSNHFSSAEGVFNALRTFFIYEVGHGHEKGFSDYLRMLLYPKHTLGIWWTEISIFIFALWAWFKHRDNCAVLFITVATLVHLLVYSLIDYKTPWLMLVPWAHACLLAGCALREPLLKRKNWPLITAAILALFYQGYQSIQANGSFPNDSRNPYAYVPTSRNVEALETWLKNLEHTHALDIAVVGKNYWPLPWYLRHFKNVSYHAIPEKNLPEKAIIVVMPEHIKKADTLFDMTHAKLFYSLRENVALTLYVDNDIWDDWTHQSSE